MKAFAGYQTTWMILNGVGANHVKKNLWEGSAAKTRHGQWEES
jgi:hypothetical protein